MITQRRPGGGAAVRHPLFARFYSRLVVPMIARSGGDDLRRRNLAGLSGTLVEVGVGEADAVVFSLVLCSVGQPSALAEASGVLRPGGELRFLEHVQAPESGATRRLQALLDATVWPRLFGGCHCGRDTAGAIEAAGFTVTALERFRFPDRSRSPESSAILGRAVPT